MGKGRKVICHNCKVKFYKDELIQVTQSKRLCKECNDNIQKEADDYKVLIQYICDGFKIKAPTGQQLKDIRRFKELGYSYPEIQYTIYYIFCIERKKAEGTGLGLVPFYYEKAKRHYELVENAKRTARKLIQEEVVVERSINHKELRIDRTRLINIEDIV